MSEQTLVEPLAFIKGFQPGRKKEKCGDGGDKGYGRNIKGTISGNNVLEDRCCQGDSNLHPRPVSPSLRGLKTGYDTVVDIFA